MIIGITGRGGSGKSTLSKKIQQRYPNYAYIEVDKIIETTVMNSQKLLHNVNTYFDDKEYKIEDVIAAYFDKNEKNNIIHDFFIKEVASEIMKFIDKHEAENFIVDWFLLHEIFHLLPLDMRIMTYASQETRTERVRVRENTNDLTIFNKVDEAFVEVDLSQIDYIFDTENSKELEFSKLMKCLEKRRK